MAAPNGDTRIRDVTAVNLEIPFEVGFRPAWRPGLVSHSRRFTLVSVTIDGGVKGWAGTDGHHAAGIDRDVRPYFVDHDVAATERHARVFRNAGGMWFVDVALWDIVGQLAGLPLYRLWGSARDSVTAYASAAQLGTPTNRVELAHHYAELGFRAMKIRFHHERMEDDLALLDAVRDVHPELTLMVDANQATDLPAPEEGVVWDYRRALRVATELEQRGVLWLEEPLSRYDFDNLRRLRDNTDIYIAGGEYNRGLHEFRWMIEQGVYDIIQGDGTISEGFSQIRKVAAMAELFQRMFVPHHGLSGLGLAAMLHLACSIPGPTWLELMYEPPTRTLETYQQLGGASKHPYWWTSTVRCTHQADQVWGLKSTRPPSRDTPPDSQKAKCRQPPYAAEGIRSMTRPDKHIEGVVFTLATALFGEERVQEIEASLTERAGHLTQLSKAGLGNGEEPSTVFVTERLGGHAQ